MTVLCTLAALLVSPLAGQQTDTTFAVPSAGSIDVDNHEGDIEIRGWDRDAVRIQAVHGNNIGIRIRRAGSVVRVDGEARRSPPHGIDYRIMVPRSFGVTVDAHSGEIVIDGVQGAINADNVQGNITVSGARGALSLDSVEGEIVVTGARGRISVNTVNQGIRITDSSGDLIDAETVNGGILLSGIQAPSVSAETVNGSIEYSGSIRDGGRYDFSTHNGSIRVEVPEGTNATVTVGTHQGGVETDFPVQLRDALSRGRLTFVLGSGAARMHLESFGGTIRLTRPGRRDR